MATNPNDDTTRSRADPPAAGNGFFDSALAGSVRDSAQQIWLAGMGAFAKAQAEGKAVFEALVKEGSSLQQKTQAVTEEHFGDIASQLSSVADEVQTKAGAQWGKLETLFEERTAKALQKLGVPSSKDMQAMQDRIDALTAQLQATRSQPMAPKAAAPVPGSTKTRERKPRTAKKIAAKGPARKAGVAKSAVKRTAKRTT